MEFEDYVRRGPYLVKEDALEEAQETFEDRSNRSKSTDKSLRAPITTDLEQYKSTGGRGVDFPGVDTPSTNPSEAVEDLPFPGGRQRQKNKNVVVARDPKRTSPIDRLSNDVDRMKDQSKSIFDVFSPE